MAVEEQTQHSQDMDFLGSPHADTRDRIGQKLTITNRVLTKLAFTLIREGTVSGDISFTIRKVSDDSVIVTKVLADASTISTSNTLYEVTFDTATAVNEEVRIAAEWPNATRSSGNRISIRKQNSDVKADEGLTFYQNSAWNDASVGIQDMSYRYTYLVASVVTTQTCTDVVGATATGRGNITTLGDNPSAHGHCWKTSSNPTTSDDSVDNGAASATGNFTSVITTLTPGTGYYTRAYVVDDAGTSYGDNVYFVAVTSRAGYIWEEGSNLRNFDENAVEQVKLNKSDVDDTSVNGATDVPISSNWAFDHNDTDSHPRYLLRSFMNGSFKEKFDATVVSSSGTITMSIEKTGGGDLTMQFSDAISTFDTTPAAAIALTAGDDNNPQANWIYIPQSTKSITKSTSSWPSGEHIRIAFFFCQSAASMETAGGPIINQNWNDFLEDENSYGHLLHIAEKVRLLDATYFSGVDGNGTTGYLTITAGNVELKSTSGVIFQLHKHTFPAFDTSTGGTVHVKNWSGDAYKAITNLHDIVADSGGNAIGTNKWFNIVIWGVQNKTGEHQTIMINLPSGFYNTQSDAENDVSGYDDFSMPRAFNIDSSVGFLIARITVKKAGTWIYGSTVDLRGTNPQTASGTAAGIITSFADNVFNVFDETDNTKVLAFDVGTNVSSGNTRTVKIQDSDGTMAYEKQALMMALSS